MFRAFARGSRKFRDPLLLPYQHFSPSSKSSLSCAALQSSRAFPKYLYGASTQASRHVPVVTSLESENLQKCSAKSEDLMKKITFKKRKKLHDVVTGSTSKSTKDWKHGISPRAVDLVEQILKLPNEKEAVWKQLDIWVASENERAIAYVKQALNAFKQQKQWNRIIQVSEWMLHRGEGKTLRTYEILLQAFDMQKYVTEAERIWKNDIMKSPWSIPGRLVSYVLDMFDRHCKPLEVIKLFTEMERKGRKFDKPSIMKVAKAYEQSGFLAMKEQILLEHNLSMAGRGTSEDK